MKNYVKRETSIITVRSNTLVSVGNSISITKKLLLEFDLKKNLSAHLKGQLKWKFETHGFNNSCPCAIDGVVYFGSLDTYLYAVECKAGQLIWKFKL